MSNQVNTAESPGVITLPTPSGYQERIIGQVSQCVLRDDRDALVVAPTGAGKTLMLSRIGKAIAEADPDHVVLIMTHRRNLHAQMTGNPSADTEKERLGEVRWASGIKPGTIADSRDGGVNLNSQVLVCMVGSTASFLEKNRNAFDGKKVVVIGDEIHHSSEAAETRDDQGDYAKVQEMLPGSKLVGFTATDYRGDGDKLHSRMEKAPRFVVAVEETEKAGRTVAAKTIVSKAKLSNGMSPNDLYEDFARKGKKDEASSEMKKCKDARYYDECLDDWEALVSCKTIGEGTDVPKNGYSTIAFTDSVEEIGIVTKKFNRRFGKGTAVMISSDFGRDHNDAAMKAYREGKAKVLVSCKMIGEGTDVPKTSCVMSFNSSITRGDMNQFVGRSVRADEGKEYGLFLDCGTGTARHGKIEEQHKIQSVRAHALSKRKSQELMAINRAAPVSDGDWHVVPGEKQSIFFKRQEGGDFRAYVLRKDLMREDGRQVRQGVDAGRRFGAASDKYDRPLFSSQQLGEFIGEHLQQEASFISRAGGLRGRIYSAKARKELSDWKERLERDVAPAKNPVSTQRAALTMAAVRNDQKAVLGTKALLDNLDKMPASDSVPEALRLSGIAFRELASGDALPLGDREDLMRVGKNMGVTNFSDLSTKEIKNHALMTSLLLREVSSKDLPKAAASLVKGLGETLDKSDRLVEREKKRAR